MAAEKGAWRLGEALDLEAVEVDGLVGEDARLHLGDEYLLVHGVDAFEVGEEEAASIAALDDDAVALAVEAVGVVDRLGRGEHVDAVGEVGQLFLVDGREARVAGGGGDGVVDYLQAYVVADRLDGADAAAQLAALLDGDEDAGAPFHLRRRSVRGSSLAVRT